MNQRIGYARVSTDDQHLDLQRDALQQAGCSVIYEEAASGKSAARPELEQCRKALRAGDTLVVWRLDRLGRSLHDLVQIVAELEQRGVEAPGRGAVFQSLVVVGLEFVDPAHGSRRIIEIPRIGDDADVGGVDAIKAVGGGENPARCNDRASAADCIGGLAQHDCHLPG